MCDTCGCGDPEVVPIEIQDKILAGNDRQAAQSGLEALVDLQYAGFLEVGSPDGPSPTSEIGHLFLQYAGAGRAVGAFRAGGQQDVWAAVRHFFGRVQACT